MGFEARKIYSEFWVSLIGSDSGQLLKLSESLFRICKQRYLSCQAICMQIDYYKVFCLFDSKNTLRKKIVLL